VCLDVAGSWQTLLTLDGNNGPCYGWGVIKSFKSDEAKRLFNREYVRKLPHGIQRVAMRKLWMIHAAPDLISLRVSPGNRLEALVGNRRGQYSIRINEQWRICFKWIDGNAHEVEIVDYH